MKTIKIFILIIWISTGKIFSQTDINVLTFNTPKGVFIQLGGAINPNSEIVIERKETSFERIAILKRPASKTELLDNINISRELFGEEAPNTENLDEVWNKYVTNDPKTLTLIQSMPQLSFVFGFSFLDKTVADGKKYQYRISSGNTKKIIEINYSKTWAYGAITSLKTEVNNKKILIWLKANTPYQYLLRFELFRKPVSSNDFRKANPVVAWNSADKAFVLMDTSLNFNGIYNYKIVTKDIFGNFLTDHLILKADNLPANISFNITRFEAKNTPEIREVKLDWEFANPDFIQSVTLFKSNKIDSNFTRIATFSPKENTWTDQIEIANELNFYRFKILDIFGRTHQSISFKHIYDLDIAASPVSLFQIENVNNLPHLKFVAGDIHTRGFYVFRKSGEGGTYMQISDLIFAKRNQGEFIDSSAVFETETLYYTVKAENDTYQKSEKSKDLSFRNHLAISQKTDLEPPYDISIRYENKQPFLFWENMNTKNVHIIGYNVYRKAENEKEYSILNKVPLSISQNYYQDTLAPAQTRYYYCIESIDFNGNKSPKSQPKVLDLAFEGNLLPQEIGYETNPTSIKINWTEISSALAKQVRIYRSENNGKPSLAGTLEAAKQQFTDTRVTKGKSYSYQMGVVDLEGKEVLHSEIISVNF